MYDLPKALPRVDTLGLVEAGTIAAGVAMTDLMIKTAPVELLRAGSICSGRYMVQVAGLKADVSEALFAAESCGSGLVDVRTLPRVSSQVIRALKRQTPVPPGSAVGIAESRRAVSGIAAADAAVKQADVILARLSVANGINGKSYLVVAGDVAAVTCAVAAACAALGKSILDHLVLPKPEPETIRALCHPADAGR